MVFKGASCVFPVDCLFALFEVVVVHLDTEDDKCADGRNEVGQGDCPCVFPTAIQSDDDSLTYKAERTKSHHEESRQRNTVSVAGTDGLDGLWQIAKDEPNGRKCSEKGNELCMFHSFVN